MLVKTFENKKKEHYKKYCETELLTVMPGL